MNRRRGRPRKLLLDAREILRARKHGMTNLQISQAYGCASPSTVTHRLRAAGIPPLRRGRKSLLHTRIN